MELFTSLEYVRVLQFEANREVKSSVSFLEGVAFRRINAETQQVVPPQCRMEKSSYTYSCGANGKCFNINYCCVNLSSVFRE